MGMPAGANSPPLSPPKRPARSWALSVCVSTAYPLAVDLAGTRLGQLVPDEYLLGHHVGRPVVYGVLPDSVHGPLLDAVSQGDRGDHVLTDGRVLHPERAGLVHKPGTQEEILDLLGAQAVTLVLYHGVLAPQEVQIPFLVALYGVARVDDPLDVQELRRGERVRAVGPLCRLLVAPVAHRHGGAPVDELARLARRRLFTFFGYHHDLRVRYRLADAVALLGGGTVDLLRREVRRAERFRQPVHEEDPGPRGLQQIPQLVEVGLRYPSPRVGEVAQMRQWVLPDGPGAPDQERPQGRHARHARDLVPPERFQEVPRQPGAKQVQGRAGPQGGRELAHPGVEVEGERRKYPVFRRVLQVRRDDLCPYHHVALARRDALWHPRGSRGVEDGPQVRLGDIPVHLWAFTLQGLRYVHVGSGGLYFRLRTPVERGLDRLGLEFLELRGVPDHDPYVTVAGEILDLGRLEQGVHVDVGGAYARGCEHRYDGLPGLVQVDANPVAPPNARLRECGAEGAALALQVFVGVLCITVHDRRFLRVARHGVVKQIVKCEFWT